MRTIEGQKKILVKLIDEYMEKVMKDIRAIKDDKRGALDHYPNRFGLSTDMEILRAYLNDYELLKIMAAADDE